MSTADDPSGGAVEKIMALTEAEFWSSLQALDPALEREAEPGAARLALPGGHVRIHFTAASPVLLGGLLSLPRARVRLVFEGPGEAARREFLRRFDIAFQRGGG